LLLTISSLDCFYIRGYTGFTRIQLISKFTINGGRVSMLNSKSHHQNNVNLYKKSKIVEMF